MNLGFSAFLQKEGIVSTDLACPELAWLSAAPGFQMMIRISVLPTGHDAQVCLISRGAEISGRIYYATLKWALCACARVLVCACACMHLCVCVSVHLCVLVHTCVHVYVHLHVHCVFACACVHLRL